MDRQIIKVSPERKIRQFLECFHLKRNLLDDQGYFKIIRKEAFLNLNLRDKKKCE